jgi:hypothetical protein
MVVSWKMLLSQIYQHNILHKRVQALHYFKRKKGISPMRTHRKNPFSYNDAAAGIAV